MKEYEYIIQSNSEKESNRELVKLWSAFENLGQFGWLYQPYKEGQNIFLGNISITGSHNLTVQLRMKTKKIVKSVLISKESGFDLKDSEITYLKKVDKWRKSIVLNFYLATVDVKIESEFGITKLSSCIGERVIITNIKSNQGNQIKVLIEAFGETHCKELILKNCYEIIDILSTQCNSLITIERISIKKDGILKKEETIFNKKQININWIDEYPIENNEFVIPKYVIDLIDQSFQKENQQFDILKRASHHFSNSLRLIKSDMPIELIISQMMSAIEVITESLDIENSNCPKCGQKVYSIRKKVLKLIDDTFKNKLMTTIFDDYYINRSKYLHSGKLASKFKYSGRCLPKISSKSRNGCESYLHNWDNNLIEWVGYIIRQYQIKSL